MELPVLVSGVDALALEDDRPDRSVDLQRLSPDVKTRDQRQRSKQETRDAHELTPAEGNRRAMLLGWPSSVKRARGYRGYGKAEGLSDPHDRLCAGR